MSADVIARGLARQQAVRLASGASGQGSALVGHVAAKANAVARTVAGKLADITSVRDFGALGNGSADDTAAIQAAINAVLSVNGGALYFPAGTYRITGKLVIPFSTGWRIFGESRAGTVLRQDSANTRIFSLEGDLTHSWEIAELGFTWASPQPAANTQAVAIYMGTGTATGAGFFNFQVRRCTFNNGFRAIAAATSASPAIWGVRIGDCVFGSSMSGAAFFAMPSPAIGQPNILIESCLLDAAGAAEPPIRITSGDNVTLRNLEFLNGTAPVGLIEVSSSNAVSLISCKTENYNAGASGSQALWSFPNSQVRVIGCSCNGLLGSGGGPRFIQADGGGRLDVFGLTCDSAMTGGNAVAYLASSYGMIAGVKLNYTGNGNFTQDLRTVVGSGVTVPRFNADLRQPDGVTTYADVSAVLTATSDRIHLWNAALTANRTCTLPGSGTYHGMEFEIALRQGNAPAAFTLTVVDPVSGRDWTFPASTNGFVRYRYVGYWEIVHQAIYRGNTLSEPVCKQADGSVSLNKALSITATGANPLSITADNFNYLQVTANASTNGQTGFGISARDGVGTLRTLHLVNAGGNAVYHVAGGFGHSFQINGVEAARVGNSELRPGTDNLLALGQAAYRWAVIYAGTGTINTSDEREKTWLGAMSPAELRAAHRIADGLGFYKWNDAVAAKGDAARVHFGARAQAVWTIMAEEGLVDPLDSTIAASARYAFLCCDRDPDGAERFGLRTDQVALFLIAALEQRLSRLERGWRDRVRTWWRRLVRAQSGSIAAAG